MKKTPLDPNALQTALAYHQSGQLAEAEALYRQILQIEPNHPDVLHFLGVLYSQAGQNEQAVTFINKAISINPSAAMYCNLGNILKGLNQAAAAIENYQKSLALNPNDPNLHYNLALILQERGELDSAIQHYFATLSLNPNYLQAYYNLGMAFKEQGKLDAAIEQLQQAILLKADYADAHSNLGLVFHEKHDWDAAIRCYQTALSFKPDCALIHNNLGVTLQAQNNLTNAIASYRSAVSLNPDYADAYFNLGTALKLQNNRDAAISSIQQAIKLKPVFPEAYLNLGDLFRLQGKLAQAIDSYQHALKFKPDFPEAMSLLFHSQQHAADWADYSKNAEKVINEIQQAKSGHTPFVTLAISASAKLQWQCAQRFVEKEYPAQKNALWSGQCYQHQKIRIAYLSADFHNHATAYLMAGLFEAHDKNRFEITAVSFGMASHDGMRQRLEKSFHRFIDVATKSDFEVAMLLRELEIDIAVDLKGYTNGGRPGILAYRPAPLQINYLGYPGTMAAEYIDYILADHYLIPAEHQGYYTEKVVYLPDSYQVNDSQRAIAQRIPTRAEVNLPAKGFVFCCFNSNYKITPEIFDIWMRLLRKVKGSVLWLFESNPLTAMNLRKEAKARGVAAERLVFAPLVRPEIHLARQQLADLFLDTLPVNAHTTASDALWAGLPVLTCMGDGFASRVAASLLNAVGLPELITDNLADYEALALKLATTPELLTEIRTKLVKNRSGYPLFDTDRFCRHLESAYLTMWERYQRGEAPASFTVPSRSETPAQPVNAAVATLFQSAIAQHQGGQLSQAEALYRQILQTEPNHSDALHFLGILAHQQGNNAQAVSLINQAISVNTVNPNAAMYGNLGVAYQAQGELDNALKSFQQALALAPNDANTHYNLGVVLHLTDKLAQAIASYQRALAINPNLPQAQQNLGGVLEDNGEWEAALLSYQRVLAIKPDYLEVYLRLAPLLLSLGRFAEGWKLLEYRYHPSMPNPWTVLPSFDFPQWQGQSLSGKSLLIATEQGFGDGIQFCRYVSVLKQQGAAFITLSCRKPLKSLFETLAGVGQVLTVEEMPTLQKHDYWSFAMSIPLHCKTTVDTIPATVPYLYPDPKQVQQIARELAHLKEFKVGICWKGNPHYKGDLQRSPGIEPFKSLFALAGVNFFTLQPETRQEFISAAGAAGVDRGHEIDVSSFAEAAALIMNLDLVISSDTSVCHLAGALGKPVWLVLPFNADWRWLKKREDSPWYPTARLFRQTERGNWQELMNRLATRLHEVIKGSVPVLWPITAVNSEDAQIYFQQGNACLGENKLEQAIENYRQAIAMKPDFADAYCNLGVALKELGEWDAAIESYHRALAITPEDAEVHSNLAAALWKQGKLDAAIASFQQAVKFKPNFPEVFLNLGDLFRLRGQLDQAIENYQQALKLKPDFPAALSMLFHSQLHCADWTAYTQLSTEIINEIRQGKSGHTPFATLATVDSAKLQWQCAQTFVAQEYPAQTPSFWTGQRYQHDKIRIAYLSADFHNHATTFLMAGLFEAHDKNRFEITAISFGSDIHDEMRQRLEKSFHRFINVSEQSDSKVAMLLRELEIDIAVDLKGDTQGGRQGILAYRPAPIQINYLGYPGTMGADYIDYILADRYVIPLEHQAYYSEKVVYLPDSYQVNDDKRAIAESVPSRTEVDLPETGFVFCCFNSNYKITPEIFDIWMRLLRKVKGSVLWLIESNPLAAMNLRKEAKARGVAAERLIFAPLVKSDVHLARQQLADLFLDTLPVNAHTTASDALWAGLPVLTCMGDSFASRVAASLLNALGLPELITDNLTDYEALALKLATTPELLTEIRTKLAKNRSSYPLFDTDRFRRHIESAYLTMWDRYQHSEAPISFAVQVIDKQISAGKDEAQNYYQQGNQFAAQGNLDAAIESYKQALAVNPENANVYFQLGNLFLGQEQFELAIENYRRAVAVKPDFADAYCNLGVAFKEQHELEQAIDCYHQALAITPEDAEVYSNLGVAFWEQHQLDAAIESYQRALQLNPNAARAHNNLGAVFKDQGKLDKAIECYQRALAIEPDYADVYGNLGTVFQEQGKLEAAIDSFQSALKLNPNYTEAFNSLFCIQLAWCDWSQYDNYAAKIIREINAGQAGYAAFSFLPLSDSAKAQQQCATLVANRYLPTKPLLWTGQRYQHEKIRLAYISADFREHAVSYLMAGVFEKHNREQFEIIAISLSPESDTAMGQRVKQAFDRFIDVSAQGDYEIAVLMRELEIDIAVDLVGFTGKGKPAVFGFRPAPVQINYLGYPGSMGARYIDYIFADSYLIPTQSQKFYTEKVAYLPDCFQANDDKRGISKNKPTRIEAGLPKSGFVFCVFNSNYKISPRFFAIWMRLLKAVPSSVLWLVADNPMTQNHLQQEASKYGVKPERLIFANRLAYPEHLARFALADVFLDTLPFNGGTTTSDALWAGVPVLTCSGEAFAARMAGSLLHAIGLPELIAANLAEYEALAIKLATNPKLLAEIRAKLAKNRLTYPLFNTERFCRYLETAYVEMWQRSQRGELPASFRVSAITKNNDTV